MFLFQRSHPTSPAALKLPQGMWVVQSSQEHRLLTHHPLKTPYLFPHKLNRFHTVNLEVRCVPSCP